VSATAKPRVIHIIQIYLERSFRIVAHVELCYK